MKICQWGSLFMKIFIEVICSWRFYFILKICSLRLFRYEDFFIAHLWGLKIVLVCSYWGLKIFLLVIWLRVIGLGLDFKMDANSGLEFGILIDSGSELKFLKWFVDFSRLFGLTFCTIEFSLVVPGTSLVSWFYYFLMWLWILSLVIVLGSWVWLGLFLLGWLGMAKLDWVFVEILQVFEVSVLFFHELC